MRTRLCPSVLFVFAACLSTAASAQVFKCHQSSGLVTYSDKPCNIVNGGRVMDRTTDPAERPNSRETFSKDAALRKAAKEPVPAEGPAKEAALKNAASKEAVAKSVSAKEPVVNDVPSKEPEPKSAEAERVVTASAEPDATKNRSAAPDSQTAESMQLRALGPTQALDRQGRVYNRVTNGYLDASGVFYAGVASGHR